MRVTGTLHNGSATDQGSPVRAYGVACLVAGLALAPWLITGSQGVPSSLLLLVGAVMAASRYGGLGPGLLTGLLGSLASTAFFLPAAYPATTTYLIAALELGGFVAVTLSISWINASLLRSRHDTSTARRHLRRQLDFTRAITDSLGEGVYAVDRAGRLTLLNAAAERMLGWNQTELVGRTIHDLIHRHRGDRGQEEPVPCPLLHALESAETSRRWQTWFTRRDGSSFPVEYVASAITTDGQHVGAVVAFHDITERRRAEVEIQASGERLRMQYAATRSLAESTSVEEAIPSLLRHVCESGGWAVGVYWELDRDQDVLRRREIWQQNPSATARFEQETRVYTATPNVGILGRVWARRESWWVPDVVGYPDFLRAQSAAKSGLHTALFFPVQVGGRLLGLMEFLHHDVRNRDTALIEAMTSIGAQIGQFIERKQAQAALEHQALHDALTDLPNRTLLQDRLQQAILAARRDGSSLALIVMDLDRFKEVNDTYGHHYGDLLLEQMKPRLRDTLRESDTVARLGGDEFAVVLPSTEAGGAVQAAHKLLHALKEPFLLETNSFDIQASIGIALYPDHGEDAGTLMRRADVAMYLAKETNSGYTVYRSDQDPNSPARLARVRELRQAIENDQLILRYQPKVSFDTLAVDGVEALTAWNPPDCGPVPADQFIPLAERTGLIRPLSRWVLEAALRQCRLWLDRGIHMRVAVNLSARNLHEPDLVQTVCRLLDDWRLQPSLLAIEITESAIMADPEGAIATLGSLHDMGVSISIDDFGTGYSSMAYLKRLPADEIKIDRSFVVDMAVNDEDACIARFIIDLGHNLGLKVVAEGVEDQATWDLLREMRCDFAQGYYLSRPLSPAELAHEQPLDRWHGMGRAS